MRSTCGCLAICVRGSMVPGPGARVILVRFYIWISFFVAGSFDPGFPVHLVIYTRGSMDNDNYLHCVNVTM